METTAITQTSKGTQETLREGSTEGARRATGGDPLRREILQLFAA